MELKKQILRTVIEEMVVKSLPESTELELQIHWAGGSRVGGKILFQIQILQAADRCFVVANFAQDGAGI